MNYQCPAEFNIPTSLLDCEGYNKRMQESTDPYRYKMDVKPGPMCMMPGRPFQGLMMAQRRPPPSLLGVETYLRSAPIVEQGRDYVCGDIHKAKPPRMPKPLSNKLLVPECTELPGYQRTKIKRTEQPDWSVRMERNGKRAPDYARPGRDTRAEVREAWKKKEQNDVSHADIYGVSKYDKRPLRPGTNPNCISEIGCMHVYGPDNVRDGKVIHPGKDVSTITATGDGGLNVLPLADWGPSLDANGSQYSAFDNIGLTATPAGPAFTSVPGTPNVSEETKRVAAGINPDVPYAHQLTGAQQRAGCNVKFFDYNPSACKA